MQKNQSGQFVYFSMISALSGTPLTGLSGLISGRKSLDGLSGMIVLSGNIIELGGGSYRANLFDFDTNGNQVGYLFTGASAAVPVQYQFDMIDGNGSGRIYIASGSITSGLIASGIIFVASGPFVNVPIATISGAIANSGLFVSVPPATLSGVIINSGAFVTVPPATLSGVVANSGLNVNANMVRSLGVAVTNEDFTVASGSATTVTVPSTDSAGNSIPDDGRYDFTAFQIVGGTGVGQVVLTAGTTGTARQYSVFSGTMPVAVDDTSRVVVLGRYYARPVTTAAISGQGVSPFSGATVIVPTSTLSGVVANSGLFVNATATVTSGAVYLASGHFLFGSGQFFLASGTGGTATVNSGSIFLASGHFLFGSGQYFLGSGSITSGLIASGIVFPTSGAFVNTPVSTLSGIVANSGLNVNATVASGTVHLASGQAVSLNSGQSMLPYSGQISQFSFASGVIAHEIPAGVLTRDFTAFSGLVASGTSGRNLLTGVRKLTNKWDMTATSGYLSVYQEDDTTIAIQQAVTATSGATPVTSLDTR